jgi:hypothetical protein
VIVGAWLARRWTEGAGAPLRGGLRIFALACGLLAAGLCVVALAPGLIRSMDDAQAGLLRPFEYSLAAILAAGGGACLWLHRSAGPRAALVALVATAFLFYGGLALATPDIQPPGTREIARVATLEMRPGDRVFHYHAFFQDFAFYARRLYGTVAFTGDELELANDPAARASGRFIDEADFRRQWAGPGRMLVVARKRDARELFADPSFHYHLLAVTADHYLFANQP